MNDHPLVKFEHVNLVYNDYHVLDNISFEIKNRAIITLIGPNGAGKTSLAKLIIGAIMPTSGSITIAKKLRLSYIPQKLSLDKNLPLTIADFLVLVGRSTDKRKLTDILTEIEFDIDLKKSIHTLSGGSMQKVLLAAALINEPQLIIMDEATQNLDVPSQAIFYDNIHRINQKYNCALFIISHDLFTVMRHSQHIICLNKHICCQGKPMNIINDPEYIKIFGRDFANTALYTHNHDHIH